MPTDRRTEGQTDMTKLIIIKCNFFATFSKFLRTCVKIETFNINSILPLSEVISFIDEDRNLNNVNVINGTL